MTIFTVLMFVVFLPSVVVAVVVVVVEAEEGVVDSSSGDGDGGASFASFLFYSFSSVVISARYLHVLNPCLTLIHVYMSDAAIGMAFCGQNLV